MAPASALLDPPGWDDGGDDFEYEGCHYAFAGWVFGRYAATPPRDALPARVRPGGLRWQHLLRRQQQRVAEAERERVGAIAEAEREREASERDIALLRQSLGRVTEDWDALTRDLRLERGPKALRLVLPLARLIRRAHLFLGGRDVAPAAAAHTDAAVAAPARSGVTPPSLSRPAVVTSGRSGMRRIGYWATRKAYYAVRPIARPVAYRMRDFLVAGLTQARQATYIPGNHAAASDATGSATELVRLAEEMERVLLTLALERPADRWSVAEAKPPEPSRGA
jgi:hypothetical protein